MEGTFSKAIHVDDSERKSEAKGRQMSSLEGNGAFRNPWIFHGDPGLCITPVQSYAAKSVFASQQTLKDLEMGC